MSKINAAASEATTVAQQMQEALFVQATSQVNVEQLRQAVALAQQLKATLSVIGTAVSAAHNAVASEMRRNFADHRVLP